MQSEPHPPDIDWAIFYDPIHDGKDDKSEELDDSSLERESLFQKASKDGRRRLSDDCTQERRMNVGTIAKVDALTQCLLLTEDVGAHGWTPYVLTGTCHICGALIKFDTRAKPESTTCILQ